MLKPGILVEKNSDFQLGRTLLHDLKLIFVVKKLYLLQSQIFSGVWLEGKNKVIS